MHRVDQSDYARMRPLFAELEGIHLNIAAVLEGNSAGVVYVDDPLHPKAAQMTFERVHYLVGDPNNSGFNAGVNAMLPRDTYFVLFCDVDRWQGAMDVVLQNTYAVRARRRYYTFAGPKIADWQQCVPDGFRMQAVDAELLARNLDNGDDLVEGILAEWCSLDTFFKRGFGSCLVHDETIVSWSCADYVSGERCEIGVNTVWGHRRRGLGTLTAAATAAHAADRGFSSIGWHCWDNNVGSIGVAENVGFVRTADYDVFINHWAAENVSDMTTEEFADFAHSYEREFHNNPPRSGFPHIVAAKAWALSGDQPGCYRHLNKAVDLGWLRSVDQLRTIWPELWYNPDLERTEGWINLARRLDGLFRDPSEHYRASEIII